ncbi:MAG: NlpC/P60 family protein [Lachnospiraceae bacterium]|nr:NlpC/P60 family protein [Lachnospiraceae bacterium]
MKIKRALSVFLATALTWSLIALPVLADPTLQEQRDAAQGEVNQLQEELVTLMTDMSRLSTQLIETGEQIIQTEKDLEAAEEDREEQRDLMMLRIRYMYENGSASAIERILSADSFAEMVNTAEYVQRVHQHDRDMLLQFVEMVNHIEELNTSLEENMATLHEKHDEYKEHVDTLNYIITTRSTEIENLDVQIAEAARIAEARRQEEIRLAAEAAAAEEAALAAAAEAANNNDVTQNVPEVPSPAPPPPLPPMNPGGNANTGEMIVAIARTAIGVPYEWGGQTMAGFDCSGLTMWAHAQVGISIPRNSEAQLAAGRPVPMGQQMPGDIAWTPGHVGIYAGGGMMIEAQMDGIPVGIFPVRVWEFVRFW